VTYDGNPHTATSTIVGVGTDTTATGSSITLNTTHTNANIYAGDTWSFSGGTNYRDIASTLITDKIGKANATFTVTPYDVTYDGSLHTATYTTITGVNGEIGAAVGAVTLSTTHTNAGTYASDTWSFTGTANYNNIANTTIIDKIGKANATFTVSPYDVMYDGNPHTATYTTITGVNGETGATVGAITLNTTHTNAGMYSDTWSFTGAVNYNNIASTPVTDKIAKINATIVVTPYNVPFDGAAHTATGSAKGLSGVVLAGLNLTGTTHTNVGTYSDTWTFTDVTGNYNNATAGITDKIASWSLSGFLQPVGIPNSYAGAPLATSSTIWNTIKGGQSVPLKFNLYMSVGGTELTNLSDAQGADYGISLYPVVCGTGGVEDPVELVTTGSTSLRYDGSQFIQNWQTPKPKDTCLRVTLKARDGSMISAFFKTK
jgi:hypothetical protein